MGSPPNPLRTNRNQPARALDSARPRRRTGLVSAAFRGAVASGSFQSPKDQGKAMPTGTKGEQRPGESGAGRPLPPPRG